MAIEYVEGQYRVKPRRASGWIGAALGLPAAMFLYPFILDFVLSPVTNRDRDAAIAAYQSAMNGNRVHQHFTENGLNTYQAIAKERGPVEEFHFVSATGPLTYWRETVKLNVRRRRKFETEGVVIFKSQCDSVYVNP